MHAIDKYDETEGVKFLTYATYWIEAYITRAIENYSKMIRYPAHYYEKKGKFKETYLELKNSLQREPTTKELQDAMHMGEQSIRCFLEMDRPICNLEEVNETFSTKEDSATILYQKEFYEDLKKSFENSPFSKIEQDIFWDLMGIDGKEISMEEASRKYGLSADQIKRRKVKILNYLKDDLMMISYYDKEFEERYERKKKLNRH